MTEQVWSNPDIYRIQVGLPQNPLGNLNVYVLCTPERNLIIDTGFCRPECRADLWQGIEELNLDLGRTALFLTHLHSDHTGLVWDFVSRGIPVYMGRVDLAYFTDASPAKRWEQLEEIWVREGFPADQMTRQTGENQARLYAPQPYFPAIPVDNWEKIPMGKLTVLALHTPGHTPGHMVLYLPEERLLFSGDHILFDITPNISVWYQVPNSLKDYLSSLSRIRALPIQTAFPAHRFYKEMCISASRSCLSTMPGGWTRCWQLWTIIQAVRPMSWRVTLPGRREGWSGRRFPLTRSGLLWGRH